MREVKFRGKCVPDSKYAGEWVTGGYVAPDADCKNQSEGLIVEYFGGNTTITYHVNPDTVGEFTGLYDKNGKDIYEGDIVKHNFSNNVFGVVKWHPLGYFYINVHWDKCETEFGYLPLGEVMHRTVNGKKIEIEVIGDIYDNPELLNKE